MINKHKHLTIRMVAFALMAMTWVSCAFSGYKFNGASIDYTKTKTIQIADFPIRSSYVCMGTYGTDVQQSAKGRVCQPYQA